MIGLDTSVLVATAIKDHPLHQEAWSWIEASLDQGKNFAITAGIVAEFIHVVTDHRRFENPLGMDEALNWANYWSNAKEVTVVHPDDEVNRLWLAWLAKFRLGRKRLLDTVIAATWSHAGIAEICTLNTKDFEIFGIFSFHHPEKSPQE